MPDSLHDLARDLDQFAAEGAGRYDSPMKVLEYSGLDISRVKPQCRRVRDAIERDDFRQTEVKKLAGPGCRPLYRAKPDDTNRPVSPCW